MSPLPPFVLLHVPHDSSAIPASIREQILLDDAALEIELLKMTDHLTFDLFARGVASDRVVRAPVSRLVVDVERFEDENVEPMSTCGMGVIYFRTSSGATLRRPINTSERQALLAAWYHPHQQLLASATQNLLDQFGRVLLIDCHSFPSQPLPYELDQRSDRPDICVGTDDCHTPVQLVQSFIRAFRADQFTVELNAPFAGAMVPQRHHLTDRRVSAVMIEVNRSLYLHEPTAEPNAESKCCVSSHGLQEVLVAVELVIESGVLSTEHVLNVLARLTAPPMPEAVDSSLPLQEAPLANTSRYDSLRGVQGSDTTAEVDHAA